MIKNAWKLLALIATLYLVAALVLHRADYYDAAQVCAQLSIAAAIAQAGSPWVVCGRVAEQRDTQEER